MWTKKTEILMIKNERSGLEDARFDLFKVDDSLLMNVFRLINCK